MPKQEKLDLSKDIIFKDFQNGIADSPHLGYAMMKNVDITTTPGVAKINFKAKKMSEPESLALSNGLQSTSE